MARMDINEQIQENLKRWLEKNKKGVLIENGSSFEYRMNAGYLIRFEKLDFTYKVSKGFLTYANNKDIVEKMYSFEFAARGLNATQIVDNAKAFINEKKD